MVLHLGKERGREGKEGGGRKRERVNSGWVNRGTWMIRHKCSGEGEGVEGGGGEGRKRGGREKGMGRQR